MFYISNVTEFALSMYKNYEPTFEQLISIKEKWVYILESLVRANASKIQLDIGDYEELAEITDEISLINNAVKKLVYEYYLKDEHASALCVDWIHYQYLLEKIKQQENLLTQNYVESICDANIMIKISLHRRL